MERKTINQISVFMENRQGQLAEILKILSNAKVDLRALNVAETEDYGVLRLIADDSEKTQAVLAKEGILVTINRVLAVSVPDRPGGLCELLETLAADGVDIEYMYSVFGKTNGKAYMIMSAKDMDVMETSLNKNNIDSADNTEMGIC